MSRLVTIFDKLENLLTANPPINMASSIKDQSLMDKDRRGNPAYRNWSRHMLRDIFPMLEQAVSIKNCIHVNELGQYLCESFGNSTRMTYGTGHELSFLFFLCALFEAEILDQDDLAASALLLFDRYLKFVRRLQVLYNLYAAGRHGAYSLDDFQFVPFLWGCAQLSYNAPFVPNRMLDADVVSEYKKDYMLMGCVGHISDTKEGTFAMHSSQLWCIASLSSWNELYGGLLDMYDKVVLRQFDLMQSARFGQLVSFDKAKPGAVLIQAQLGVMSPLQQKLLEGEDEVEEEENWENADPTKKNGMRKNKKKRLVESSSQKSHSAVSSGIRTSSLSDICVYLRKITDVESCPIETSHKVPIEAHSDEQRVPETIFKFHTRLVEPSDDSD
ncbi:serine/threonine-protein phosphatase 2A activator [Drosophila tropicalis]|uniref:serine/threonine-protein phosphatase 2A activator n=1 Tax=Drosophila tropicalis TaxID=46794 RepID=UPI0035ABB78D